MGSLPGLFAEPPIAFSRSALQSQNQGTVVVLPSRTVCPSVSIPSSGSTDFTLMFEQVRTGDSSRRPRDVAQVHLAHLSICLAEVAESLTSSASLSVGPPWIPSWSTRLSYQGGSHGPSQRVGPWPLIFHDGWSSSRC